MTLTPNDPVVPTPAPASPFRARARRTATKLSVVLAVGTVATAATTIWPVVVVPLTIFMAGATLAVEALDLLKR